MKYSLYEIAFNSNLAFNIMQVVQECHLQQSYITPPLKHQALTI